MMEKGQRVWVRARLVRRTEWNGSKTISWQREQLPEPVEGVLLGRSFRGDGVYEFVDEDLHRYWQYAAGRRHAVWLVAAPLGGQRYYRPWAVREEDMEEAV